MEPRELKGGVPKSVAAEGSKTLTETKRWMKLDNAAKIYPATMSRTWTALFRLSANLTETVDPAVLQQAVNQTIKRFPSFAQRLRRGMFWYYFEEINATLRIQRDAGNPCVRMNFKENSGYMLRVRYYENRIAVEFFHALTDGSGATVFLMTLVAEYLALKYGAVIPRNEKILDCSEKPKLEEVEDAFFRFQRGIGRVAKEQSAFRIPGTEENFLHIVTGILDIKEVLALAKKYGCTLTEFLTAVMIMSVADVQKRYVPSRRRYKPVKISVPVNLRRFYKTSTLRNFSSYVNLGIEPRYGDFTFEETLKSVKGLMAAETNEKMLNAKFSMNVMFETNLLMKIAPLFVKKVALRIASKMGGDRLSSTTISNLGGVDIPDEMARYVARFECMSGPLKTNRVGCACISYNGKLVINMTRKITESYVERGFFSWLVKLGLHVTIESNQRR